MSSSDFLRQTLAGTLPELRRGETAGLTWQWLDNGIMQLLPRRPAAASVVVSAGVHGNETAPVELLDGLLAELLAGRRELAVRLLVVLGNPGALRAGRRYLVNDLNRMFGQRGTEGFIEGEETARSRRLQAGLRDFFGYSGSGHDGLPRWHVDLHTAIRGSRHVRFALLPYQREPYAPALLAWLAAAGLDALVTHRAAGSTFTHFSSDRLQAASATLELGKALPFGDNDHSQFSAAREALAALIGDKAWPARQGPPMRRYRVSQQITRSRADFALLIPPDTLNFTCFSQGELLARENGREYRVREPREWVLFPNPAVALGLRAGLMLVEEPEPAVPGGEDAGHHG